MSNIAVPIGWDNKRMCKGATAVSPFTAPVLRADEILPSLHPFVALQDLTPSMRLLETYSEVVLDELGGKLLSLILKIKDAVERIGKLIEIGEYCGIEVAILAYASITMVAGAFQVLTTAFFTLNPVLGVAVGMLGVWSVGVLAEGWLQKCQQ